MSFNAVTEAFESSVRSRTDLLVLVSLAQRADPRTSECWPGIERIARDARISRRAVFLVLNRLESEGHITRDSGRGNHCSNHYRIHPVKKSEDTSLSAPKVNEGAPLSDAKVNGDSPLGCTAVHSKGERGCTRKGNESSRKNKRDDASKRSKTPVDHPLPFESSQFREAWKAWKTHRRELGKKFTDSTQKAQLRKLAKMGEERAVECLWQSIENGWQGLFPPKSNPSKPTHSVLGQPSLPLKL